jgi:5-formyltetrahydrofolate cyclo-ligase
MIFRRETGYPFKVIVMTENLKTSLRQEMIRKRDHLNALDRNREELFINQELIKIVQKTEIASVHTFLPMGNELNIYPFIQDCLDKKIMVVVPKTLKKPQLQHLILHSLDQLKDGPFNTQHPAEEIPFDGHYNLIIVPGLAFDKAFNRLGYGGGYYDNFLKNNLLTFTLGVCFSFQFLETVPTEPHDIKLNGVLYGSLE